MDVVYLELYYVKGTAGIMFDVKLSGQSPTRHNVGSKCSSALRTIEQIGHICLLHYFTSNNSGSISRIIRNVEK